jgi:hypothetical protein
MKCEECKKPCHETGRCPYPTVEFEEKKDKEKDGYFTDWKTEKIMSDFYARQAWSKWP